MAGRAFKAGLCAWAGAACVLAAAASPALADHPLEPDLQTVPLTKDRLEVFHPSKKSRTVLGITNEVGNAGAGPLEISPSEVTPECVEASASYTASQTVYDDSNENNFFERGVDTNSSTNEIGCLTFHAHPKHNHWHVLDFAKYSLRGEKTGKIAESKKVGFCLLDGGQPFDFEVPGTPETRKFSGNCSFGNPTTPPGVMGISIGWSDIYGIGTPGQQIRIDGLPKGRYCLRSEADPSDNILETDDSNNATEVRIRLNPKKLRVERLAGACEPL